MLSPVVTHGRVSATVALGGTGPTHLVESRAAHFEGMVLVKFNLRELMAVAAATEAVDYATIRKTLPVAYLLEKYGVALTVEANRLKCICPFHEDSNPSFSVFGEGLEHWSCWSCGAKGDATDMLKRFEPGLVRDGDKDSTALFRRARELITEVIDTGWTGPSAVGETKAFDIQAATEIVDASQLDINFARIQEFVDAKREQRGQLAWPYTAHYLQKEWSVGTYGSWIVIPYFDTDGELVAYKRWTSPERPRMSAEGTGIWRGHLYGENRRDDPSLEILLCEGESDCWYAHHLVGDRYRVLGLPTGAGGSSPANIEWTQGRTVLIAFDGDDAGRSASQVWSSALEAAGANVKIVPIPEKRDLSTAGDIAILLTQARPPVKAPSGIRASPNGYTRQSPKGETTQISNFTFHPERGLHGDGILAFEGRIRPGGDKAVIRNTDLSSDTKVQAWAGANGKSWYGNSKEARMVLGLLQSEEVFLPSGRMVTVAGLHNGTFIWPGGQLGPEPLTYVSPQADAGLARNLHIDPGSADPIDMLHKMRAIQRREVTDPFLGWLAAAPLRTLYERFPFVAVMGEAESGKTETTETLISSFSGSFSQQTFKSSAHAMISAIAASNAFPVQLEEYRPEGNSETLKAGRQIFREGYTMQPLKRGGGGENWMTIQEIIPAAPIVMTGEDELTEKSLIDRMIPIEMYAEFQNPEPFEYLRENTAHGFAHAYLSWLRSKFEDGTIPLSGVRIEPAGPEDLGTRQRYNIGVLQYGWRLLQEFARDHNDSLDNPNFSAVIAAMGSSNKRTPIEEAINWCVGEPEAMSFCRYEKESNSVKIQVEGFLAFLSHPARSSMFIMPGGVATIKRHLLGPLNAQRELENQREMYRVDYDRLKR